MSDTAENSPAFEETLERLRKVVGQLEAGGDEGAPLPLEQSLRLFEEGVGLAKSASGALEAADARVEALLADGTVEPLDSEGV
jgi:exodeoxyribonuclease VII small subunit